MKVLGQLLIRVIVIGAALFAASLLIWGWRAQTAVRLSCPVLFEPRRDHNGYLQINVLGPHQTEEYFKGELFLY